ncbi:MAG: response regulator [Nitrospiraceae bacterium]
MIPVKPPAKTLLVVDRCRDTRALALERAREKGLSVITAPDPDVARTTLDLTVPDVVLTDMFGPTQSGVPLIRHIRSRYPLCAIILMAEDGNDATVLEALRAGAVDYLTKPMIGEELSESLDRALVTAPGAVEDIPGIERLEYRLTIGTDPASVEKSVSWLIQGTAVMLPETQRLHVRATLIELMLNAVEHGSLEIFYREKKEALARNYYEHLVEMRRRDARLSGRKVTACASYDKRARTLRYSVSDEGKGFPWRTLLNRDDESCTSLEANGRGLFLARAFFPDLTYNDAGNEVSFSVPLA